MEILDIVNENGKPTGKTVEREAAHASGIRHRTSHVWLVRKVKGKWQVLLQKRSHDKDSYPDCYDSSSAGHIPAGVGFVESAIRELKEELGLDAAEDEIHYCGVRVSRRDSIFHGRLFCDNQVSNVYIIGRDINESDVTVQKEEVDSVLWMDLDECVEMVEKNLKPNCIREDELQMVVNGIDKWL